MSKSRTKKLALSCGVAVGLLSFGCLAAPALAVTMQATFTGTIVNHGLDAEGFFGLGAGATVLLDKSFSLRITYDPESDPSRDRSDNGTVYNDFTSYGGQIHGSIQN